MTPIQTLEKLVADHLKNLGTVINRLGDEVIETTEQEEAELANAAYARGVRDAAEKASGPVRTFKVGDKVEVVTQAGPSIGQVTKPHVFGCYVSVNGERPYWFSNGELRLSPLAGSLDLPALLAHVKAMEKVCEAARAEAESPIAYASKWKLRQALSLLDGKGVQDA